MNDLLEEIGGTNSFDYLSVDTEGSQYDILKDFNFKKYKFKIITVEHNYQKRRLDIYNLLCENGYRRVHEDLSFQDDWYVLI